MLKRFYADNYRCLVNFELRPSATNLIVGRNGSGKSSVLQGLRTLRDYLRTPQDLKALFSHTKAHWETRPLQRFELEIETGPEVFKYVLQIDHTNPGNPRLVREELSSPSGLLFFLDSGRVNLFTENHESRGDSFEFSSTTSALASFAAKGSAIDRFLSSVGTIFFFSPDPRQMEWSSSAEARSLNVEASNLPSWLRAVSQENPQEFLDLTKSLREVIIGFEQLRFLDLGASKALQVVFSSAKGRFIEGILDLSDGERCLIALYSVLNIYAKRGYTLVFDEPDNFLALDEIGPWLHRLRDEVDESNAQVIVASHHPDIIDYLAADDTFIVTRPSSDIVRIAPFLVDREDGGTASEELRHQLSNEFESSK